MQLEYEWGIGARLDGVFDAKMELPLGKENEEEDGRDWMELAGMRGFRQNGMR